MIVIMMVSIIIIMISSSSSSGSRIMISSSRIMISSSSSSSSSRHSWMLREADAPAPLSSAWAKLSLSPPMSSNHQLISCVILVV